VLLQDVHVAGGANMTISTKENIVDTEGQQGRRHALALLGGVVGVAITTPAGLAQPLASPQAPRRVFVTGSSDGLGLEAARQLIALGHHVILHGRNRKRADDAMAAAPGAVAVVVGDVSVIAETRALADQVNKIGPCDAVIHNVGISGRSGTELTPDGLSPIFAVNTLAPFTLTALIGKPRRLVYLSSSASRGVRLDPADLTLTNRGLDGWSAYGASAWRVRLIPLPSSSSSRRATASAVAPALIAARSAGVSWLLVRCLLRTRAMIWT
jgi:NAD(P)-dependent dehydrogenase (short-subunit alcohol dehydrogenase family)